MNAVPLMNDLQEVILRLGAAVLAGAVIGINRVIHHKPAGLKTHSLVGLGAALITVASIHIAAVSGDSSGVLRAVQGIITGIGFLGAGVIFHSGDLKNVQGLTTAASIWVVASLGIACGAGQWLLAAVATAFTLIVLVIGVPVENIVRRFAHREDDNGMDSESR